MIPAVNMNNQAAGYDRQLKCLPEQAEAVREYRCWYTAEEPWPLAISDSTEWLGIHEVRPIINYPQPLLFIIPIIMIIIYL